MGKTVPEVLSTARDRRPRAVLRPRPVNNIFIFLHLRCKSFRKIFLTFQPMCVELAHVHFVEARDRSQTKTKHYTMIFSSVIYIFWHSVLSFRIKKGFCVLLDNS